MKPVELKKIVRAMRQCGVLRLVTADMEIELGPEPLPKLTKSEEQEIPHTLQEMKSVMKLSDGELVDRLFPDTQTQIEDEANELPN